MYAPQNLKIFHMKLLEFLDKGIRVFPNPQSLKISQNRILEKSFLKKNNIPTTEYYEINSEKDIEVLCNLEKWPYILKTSTFGYDGKGPNNCSRF